MKTLMMSMNSNLNSWSDLNRADISLSHDVLSYPKTVFLHKKRLGGSCS